MTQVAPVLEGRNFDHCPPDPTPLRSRVPYGASDQNFGYRREGAPSKVTVTHSSLEVTVTRASLREYAAVQRERDLRAPRAEKHRLLNEVVVVTGLHRKAAIRLLRRPLRPRARVAPARAVRAGTAPPWPPRPSCSPRPRATSALTGGIPFSPNCSIG